MGFGWDENEKEKEGSAELVIFMGKGVEIKGDLRFTGSGRIDGKITGKISVKGSLTLGSGADISSEIEADTVIVGGKVKGKIEARQKIQLLKTATVNSDLTTPNLIVEEGAQFNGSAKMETSDPFEVAPVYEIKSAKGGLRPALEAAS